MEGCAHLPLQVAVEIDEQVAAGNKIDVRERRVLQQAVLSKNDDISHLAPYAVVIAFARKESAQTVLGVVGLNGQRITSLASSCKCCGIQVRGEQLKLRPLI